MLKKVWNFMKNFAKSAMEVVEKVEGHTAQPIKMGEPKPPSYWAEYAEQLQMLKRAEQYEQEQEMLVKKQEEFNQRFTNESIDAWRENNRRVNEYFNRHRVHARPKLHLVG